MIFARKGFAATLLDLKMSLGLDIAVGGLVSFKLRVRVSIYCCFSMSAKCQSAETRDIYFGI